MHDLKSILPRLLLVSHLMMMMLMMMMMMMMMIITEVLTISFPRKQHDQGKFIIINNAGYFQIFNLTHRFPDKYTIMAYNCNPYYRMQSEYSGVLRNPEPFDQAVVQFGEDIDSLWDNHPNNHILNLQQKYQKYVPTIIESFKLFNVVNVAVMYRPEFNDWLLAHQYGILCVGGSSNSNSIPGNKTSMSANLTLATSWLSDSILDTSLMAISHPLRISQSIPDPRIIRISNGRYYLVSNNHIDRGAHISPFYLELYSSSSDAADNVQITKGVANKIYEEDIVFIEVNHVDHKNWTPFEYKKEIYFLSMVWPFQVVSVSIHPKKPWIGTMVTHVHQDIDDSCMPLYNWSPYHHRLRGGSQAIQLSENRYFSIFHASGNVTFDDYGVLKTYTMGAYTFEMSIDEDNDNKISSRLLSLSVIPFIHETWYNVTWKYKPQAFGLFDYIVFPLTIMLEDEDNLFVIYGKQDEETWISRFSLKNILSTMIDVNEDGTCSTHADMNMN